MRAEGFVSPRREGRGGSVSRRDLSQLARNRTKLAGGTKPAESTLPNASRSSGGSAREGLLSEKPPLPQNLRHPSLASLVRLPPACYRFALFGELGVEAGGGPEGVRGG